MDIKESILLKNHTTFKIGGPAKYFCFVKNKEELIEAINFTKENNFPLFVLGSGSNVLALDKGFNGLVVKMQNSRFEIQDSKIFAESGLSLSKTIDEAKKASLSGLEWAVGIPGTIGGAVYGNARAFGLEMSDIIKEVEVLDVDTLEIKTLAKEECRFSEKQSIFKKKKNLIILSVVLTLKKGEKEKIEKEMKEKIDLRHRRQPIDYPSAGSMFINTTDKPSSYLIDQAGLKGVHVGKAVVSEKHAGFVINKGGASSKDVLALIEIIQKKVKEKHNIDLELEIKILQ